MDKTKEFKRKKEDLTTSLAIMKALSKSISSRAGDQEKHEKKYKRIQWWTYSLGIFFALIFSLPFLYGYIIQPVIMLGAIGLVCGTILSSSKSLHKLHISFVEDDAIVVVKYDEIIREQEEELRVLEETEKAYNDYLKEKEESYAKNIADYSIGDKFHKGKYEITDMTKNSIEVFVKRNDKFYTNEFICGDCGKKTILDKKKSFVCSGCKSKNKESVTKQFTGINHKQWYTVAEFNKLIK